MPRRRTRRCPHPLGILPLVPLLVLTSGLVWSAEAAGQERERAPFGFKVTLRVELRDHFDGAIRTEPGDAWRASYMETGEWVLHREVDELGDAEVSLDARRRVRDVDVRASRLIADGCGNEWLREFEDPARVERESEVQLEPTPEGAVAVWYRPLRPSLIDPGGPRGRGECADAPEDSRERVPLIFDPMGLERRIDTESGLPAVRPDGSILLAVLPWSAFESGKEVRRGVRYGDSATRFRARLQLEPAF